MIYRVLFWPLGLRVYAGPEAVRITVPRWSLRLWPGLLEVVRRKIELGNPELVDVRIVARSIIVRLR